MACDRLLVSKMPKKRMKNEENRLFFPQNHDSDNPGQKSLGQYCNIDIFRSVLGYLLKQCILFEILLQFSLPPSYTKLKLGQNTRVQHCLWCEGRGWTSVNWKTLRKCKSVLRLLSMIVGKKEPTFLQSEKYAYVAIKS